MTTPAVAESLAAPIDAPVDSQRRALLLGAGLVTGFAALGMFDAAQAQSNLSAEDRAVVQRAQTYLQGLTSAQGTFVETGPGGQRREGRFYLQRPGKMRFEYTNPAGLLVVSDGSNVKRYDPRLSEFKRLIGPMHLLQEVTADATTVELSCYGYSGALPRARLSIRLP